MAIIPQSRYETYLTSGITATATTIPVAVCPASGVTSGFVRIGEEIIKFEGNSNPSGAGNLTSCTRGLALSGTTETDAGLGVAHTAGSKVIMSDIHYYLNNAAAGQAITISGTPVANDFARWTSGTALEGRSYAEVKADLNLEIGTDVLAQQTIGIADNNLVEIDSSSVADNEYARFTPNGLESRSVAELRSDINVEDGADVTDTANVTAAGALMDSEVTNLADVKAFDTADYATAAQGSTADSAMQDLSDDTTPQLGGDLDAQANHIGFTQQTVTYNSGTTTVDWGAGNKAKMTFGAGNITTFAFTNPPKPSNLTLVVVQDGTGSRTVTGWDADIKWAGGSAPTLSTGANAIDILSFYWDGTNYYGVASLNFS